MALGLTQADLGQRAGCSVAAIRKFEADKRRPSQQLAERLADQLALPLEEHAAFVAFARVQPLAEEQVWPSELVDRAFQRPPDDPHPDRSAAVRSNAGAPSAARWRVPWVGAALGGALVLVVLIAALALDLNTGSSARPSALGPAPTAVAISSNAVPAPALTTVQTAGGRGKGDLLRIFATVPDKHVVKTFNPYVDEALFGFDAARLVLEPLAAFGPDGIPRPALAAIIPTVANGGIAKDLKTVTWKLRPDVKWSDGSPFSADDVVFTYAYCVDPQTRCTTAAWFDNAETVEALDLTTVRITWKAPNPNSYQMFVGYTGYILQKRQFAACIGANARTDPACAQANLAPIGTGPYQVRSFEPGDGTIYDINESYRDPDKPYFKEVRFRFSDDPRTTARAVFETKGADYVIKIGVDAAELRRLIEIGKGKLIEIPGPYVERLLLNRSNPDPALGDRRSEPDLPHPFLSDARVRQALTMAIDRKTLAEQYYSLGVAAHPACEIVVTQPFIAPDQLYGGRNTCDPDIEAAQRLLDQAGWRVGDDGIRLKNGTRLQILFQTTRGPERQKAQELIKTAWQQLGVAVELKSVATDVFFRGGTDNPDTAAHFYADVELFSSSSDQPDQTTYLCGWASDQIARKSNGWSGANLERFSSAEYDILCARLRTETDAVVRKELILRMNDILVQEVVTIPLVTRRSISAHALRIRGVDAGPWDVELWNIADWTAES
jgi:peptide/nickel transport system substrate-binding protein